ncbi:MAG: MaoC family dehydratase [Brevundimonas sp.]|uniref:MaoC family dehydratase n=1 Tax=Brevundimonas sp. TaxID=1871086 RepID=UPI0025C632BC|nr:MaoC family dehydratase [Brevundimonas sp.]MBX3477730.1 MaoC family dehydratase [Brevundimonas sp.]
MAIRQVSFSALPGLAGCELGRSAWREITQAQVDDFAALSGDRQWIHVDRERATRERGGTIAHGGLILSLMSAMTREIVEYVGVGHGFNYGYDRLRFVSPTPTGSRIRLVETLVAVEAKGAGLKLRRRCVVEIEGAERPALSCDWLTILYPGA